ncbi:hypothetical protein DFP92_12522 [Yoonia sediminilitoris]|uniref:Uncharacterized protein n=1 Tax=Yoonia sediminilitoris TaxID=1286148 RepID=A0A2T6K5A0_9RHOB|nr:hypothetical protein C8N45_12522 [Yoonia sediminilitoris]RCW89581.1 hypothetical protein DFP92_12522 [Yoonia sediminilitoris]
MFDRFQQTPEVTASKLELASKTRKVWYPLHNTVEPRISSVSVEFMDVTIAN